MSYKPNPRWLFGVILIIILIIVASAAVTVTVPTQVPSVTGVSKPVNSGNQGATSAIVYSPSSGFNDDKSDVWFNQAVPGTVGSKDRLVQAPLNPDFIEWQKMQPAVKSNFGDVPSPVQIPRLDLKKYPTADSSKKELVATYPASWDLRSSPGSSWVTSVKNQNPCGSCWAHAAMASLEGWFRPTTTYDFSENSLKNDHLYDYGPCEGGNVDIATGTLARWTGPFLESQDPYYPGNVAPKDVNLSKLEYVTAGKGVKNVQRVYYIPTSSTQPNPNAKFFVYNYGPVYANYYHSNTYYRSDTAAYYHPSATSTNHAVAIIGWNDNYPRSNFKSGTLPPGNGAWLVKNSWGTSWGKNGYFWVSYYDKAFAKKSLAFFTAGNVNSYSRIYQYDILGWTSTYGYSGLTSAWGANVFTARATATIKAVATYFSMYNSQYTLEIWRNPTSTNPRSGTKIKTQTGTVSWPGYVTIPISSPPSITAGQKFSVVMKYTTPGYQYPIPTERRISGYSTKATNAGTGLSWVSSSGSSWYDLSLASDNKDVALKAFQ